MHLYMLTVGRVLTTNVSQINLGQLLFRATLKVMFVTTLGMDNFDCTKVNAHFKKFMTCTAIWVYILSVCRRPENKLYENYARIDGIELQRIIFPKYLRMKFLLGGDFNCYASAEETMRVECG